MSEVQRPSPTSVPHFLAKQVSTAAGAPSQEELAGALAEIELETQIAGASFIKVSVIDPEWAIGTSGFIDMSPEGLLQPIKVEFPERSGWWWRLCAVELTNDVTQPNLILTFEDRIIAYLRDHWGPKSVPAGTTTRAQFIKFLVDEVGVSGKVKKIRFVCPELNVVQELELSTEGELTDEAQAQLLAKENKSRGVGSGAQITIKGAKPSRSQRELINKVMAKANSLQSPVLATEALIEACIEENDFTNSGEGILQVIPSTAAGLGISSTDVEAVVGAFLQKGFGGQGGAIEYAQKHPSSPAYKVAQAVQASGAGAASDGAATYGQWKAEAQAIVAAYGGVTLGKKATGESDVSQLKRGSKENPDEDSWEAITRLATQVGWFAFTNGNNLFYMDGPDLRDQKPSLFMDIPANKIVYDDANGEKVTETGVIQIPLTGNIDNTAFEYRETHKIKGRVQHKSRISKPSTPSEIKVQLVCEMTFGRAGDVWLLENSGPFNGRWIVTDAVRNCLKDRFTTFTLEPPVAPLPEPQAASIGASAEAANSEGKARSAVEAAQKALLERGKYVYSEAANRSNKGTLFGPAPRTMDCSAFCILAYKDAGLPDPAGFEYKTIGNTASVIARCKKVSEPKPGAFCFFGASESATTHMTLYIGGGRAISMGKQGDPEEGPADTTGPSGFLGYYEPK